MLASVQSQKQLKSKVFTRNSTGLFVVGFILGATATVAFCLWLKIYPNRDDAFDAKLVKQVLLHPSSSPQPNLNSTKYEPTGKPLTPDDVTTGYERIDIPSEIANVLFDDAVNFHDLSILPAWRQKLKLNQIQASQVEKILKQFVEQVGLEEASAAKLETKANGDQFYLLNPNPNSNISREKFVEEIKNALGEGYPHSEFLAAALGHSRALSGFGSTKREIYVTDYTFDGKTSTVVEVTEHLSKDEKKQGSRAYTIAPNREFVKLRYPFLK